MLFVENIVLGKQVKLATGIEGANFTFKDLKQSIILIIRKNLCEQMDIKLIQVLNILDLFEQDIIKGNIDRIKSGLLK